jgi:hypothetical protein
MTITTIQTLTAGQTSFAVSDLQPGDVILWVWHRRTTTTPLGFPPAPGSVLTILEEGEPITWAIASTGPAFLDFSNSGGDDHYPNYILSMGDGSGSDYEQMFLIAYPISTFVAGSYTLTFTLSGLSGTNRIAWGKILRGVSLTSMGQAVQTYRTNVSKEDGYTDAPYRLIRRLDLGGGIVYNDYPYSRGIEGGTFSPAYIVCINTSIDLKPPLPSYGTNVPIFSTYNDRNTFQEVGIVANGSYTFVDPGEATEGLWWNYGGGAATSWLILRETGWETPPAATVYFVDMLVFNAATGATINF